MESERQWSEILDKLAKIKALSDRAGTLEEAQAATAALSRMLLRYNLTMEQVTVHLDGQHDRGFVRQDATIENGAMWRAILLNSLARAHFCRCVRHGSNGTHSLFGQPHNIVVVKDLYSWLVDEVERLAKTGWPVHLAADIDRITDRYTDPTGVYADYPGDVVERYCRQQIAYATGQQRAWKNSFRQGAVSAIGDTLREARAQARQDAGAAAWGLVPVLEQDLEDAFRKEYGLLQHSRASVNRWHAGYDAGYAAGRGINVGSRQVGGASAATAALGG